MLVLSDGKGKKRVLLTNCVVKSVTKYLTEFDDPLIPKVEFEAIITHGSIATERAEIKVITQKRIFKKGQKVDIELR